jgi:peptidoglycan-associated lipoprotein
MMKTIASILLLGLCLSGCQVGCKKKPKMPKVPMMLQQHQGNQQGESEFSVALEEDKVFFAFDSSDLSTKAREIVDQQIRWLAAHPEAPNAILEGHCDKVGTREYNLALGERRAEQVKRYMVSRGVASERLEVRSYGKEKLMNLGDNPEDHAINRRVVLVIQPSR